MNDRHANPNLYRQDFGATTPNIRLDPDPRAPAPQYPPPPPQPPRPPQGPAPRRGLPVWVWALVGGGSLLLIGAIAAVVIYLLLPSPGFTLIIRNAPPSSDVFVDNVRRGVTKADGTITVLNLKAGKRIVKVSHTCYEDFNSSITGRDGETKPLIAGMTQTFGPGCGTPPPSDSALPKEIEYAGPMMLVAQGEFIMGNDNEEPDEKPAHKVTLPDFYIDKFEVTNEQYKKFSTETRRPLPSNPWWDPNYLSNGKMPVVGVSWDDAVAYAKWAGKRLPTEEEWEKAASWDPQEQKKRVWPWGEANDQSRANLGTKHPTNVGQFAGGASAYGVHDMVGNVLEWTADYYKAYPNNSTPDPNFGTTYRVVRGGGRFLDTLDSVHTTNRIYNSPQFTAAEKRERSWLIGFRCAVSADDPKLKEHLQSAGGAK